MKFTIVTPSYNQGQFIEETILSVLNQKGDFSIDYIVADGGSNDATIEILKKYDTLLREGAFPMQCNGISFRWWSRKDRGQSDAINQGFKLATGEILAWINSDDFYEQDTLQEVSDIFNSNPTLDFVYGDGYVYFDGNPNKGIKRSTTGTFNDFLRRYRYIFQPSAFWKKSLLDKVGFLDEDLNFIMDYELWLRIFKREDLVKLYVPKVWSNYRSWESSKSVAQMDKFMKERRKIFKKYGGNKIDPYFIQRVITSRYFNQVRKINPKIASKLIQIIQYFSDSLHY